MYAPSFHQRWVLALFLAGTAVTHEHVVAMFAFHPGTLASAATWLSVLCALSQKAPFLETNPFSVHLRIQPQALLNGASYALASKHLEQVWGSRYSRRPNPSELAKFIVIVCAAVHALISATFRALALINVETSGIAVHGLVGLITAFCVAFKQAIPEHTVDLYGVFAMRVKHVPSVIVLAHIVLFALGYVFAAAFSVLYAAAVAWVYIRFVKTQDGLRGDRSEAFAFASFFPDAMQYSPKTHPRPAVRPLSTAVFKMLVFLHVLAPIRTSPALVFDMKGVAPLVSADLAEAERRRALAVKALDTRLLAKSDGVSNATETSAEDAA